MCSGFLWYNYLVALNSFGLCIYSTSSSTKALQWINELLVTSGTFPLKSSLASCELIPLQASSWEKVRKWMSSRDIAELPQEHIFTLVLFFRDQTWGNAELLAVPPTEYTSQPEFSHGMALGDVLCSPLLPSLGPAREVLATQTSSKPVASPSCVSFRFLPKYFVVFLIAKDFSCSLLSFISL